MALIACKECKQQVSSEAATCPQCGAKVPKKMGVVKGLILVIFGVYVFGTLADLGNSGTSTTAASVGSTSTASSSRSSAMDKVELTKYGWSKDYSLMKLDATIKNNNEYSVKDIEITCNHSAPSGTKIDSNKRTIYQRIEAGKKLNVNGFDMGFIHSQAESTNCKITGVVPG